MAVTLLLAACILADMFINDFSMITMYAGSAIVVCVVTSSGGDFGVNMDRGRIGIRLSLVDRANPENVISVNSKGEKMVVDCLYVTPSTYIDYVGMEGVKNGHLTNLTNDNEYSAVKTQNYTEKNIIVRIFADQIKETLIRQGFPDDIATPVPWTKYEGNAYHSKGNEFVEWLWKDQDGNVVQSNGGALATSYTTSSGTVVSVKPADPAGKMLVGEVGDTKFKAVNSSAYYSYSMLSSKLNQKGVDMLIGPVFPSLEEKKAPVGQNIAYMRVSTVEQHLDRQKEALEKYQIDKWFSEKVSGKNTDRPEFQKMMQYLREGDTLYVADFSRLARSSKDLFAIADELEARGINLVSDKEKLDTNTAYGKFMFTMIGAMAEFERSIMLERQRDGIEQAKVRGVYKGRKPVTVENFGGWYERYQRREFNKGELAKQLNISRPTLDKLIRQYEKEYLKH